jgi:hypothetical protein
MTPILRSALFGEHRIRADYMNGRDGHRTIHIAVVVPMRCQGKDRPVFWGCAGTQKIVKQIKAKKARYLLFMILPGFGKRRFGKGGPFAWSGQTSVPRILAR